MATSKNTTKAAKPKAAENTADKSSEKAAAKSAAPAVATSININPANAAQSVAAALAARAKQTTPAGATGGDSAAFKKFKDGLLKPHFSAGSPLAGAGPAQKFNGPNGFAKQTGHNQTNTNAAARTGVPRRTSGG